MVAVSDTKGILKVMIEKLEQPVSLVVSPDGRVVVAEAGADRVRIFDISGEKPVAVREITEHDGAPLGKPVAVSLDRFMRIVVAREGQPPAVLDPPTDFIVRIEPERGLIHKLSPNPCRIFITNIGDKRTRISKIISRIGVGGAARQADFDKRGMIWASPGQLRRVDTLIAFPWEEKRGIVPAEFRFTTLHGEQSAYTTVELHDLVEHRVIVEKMPVEKGDRWVQYKGQLVVTAYAPRRNDSAVEVTTAPRSAGLKAQMASDGLVVPANGTVVLPFEVLMPVEGAGLRAQVTVRLNHLGKDYASVFDLQRPIPWRMAGPFDNADKAGFTTAYPPEEKVEIARGAVMPDGTTHRWVTVPDNLYDEKDGVFFHEHFKDADWKAVYVTTVIACPDEREALLKLGSDDQVVVWLNGTEVHRNAIERGAAPDQDEVKVTLRKGNNRVLMKICNSEGGWGYYFRVTNREGQPYYDLSADADTDWNPPED